MDGFKISQRKIMFSVFKRNLIKEIKVAQLSGYVSEHSGYHHGEASLNGAIIGLAQNYVGSNNINILVPSGQFGTRLQGGKDSASERYIFTQLCDITRAIFPSVDDTILTYLDDDGTSIEPIYYVPILPMILVNGSKGIGTGFSTEILQYNPIELVQYLQNKLLNENKNDITNLQQYFLPYYRGFNGVISEITPEKFLICGCYEVIGIDQIVVTELPIGLWTQDFKELLEELIDIKAITQNNNKQSNNETSNDSETGISSSIVKGKKKPTPIEPIIKEMKNQGTDTKINFIITFHSGKLNEYLQRSGDYGCNGVEKILKLYTTVSTTNMHLFTADEKLKKYATVPEIINDFYDERLLYYIKRKENIIKCLENQLIILSNKAQFIQANLDGNIDLRKKTKIEIQQILIQHQYNIIDDDDNFHYLVKMPMDSVSNEKVISLLKEYNDKKNELDIIKNTTPNQMWTHDLTIFMELYQLHNFEWNIKQNEDIINKPNKPNKQAKIIKSTKTTKKVLSKK